ncbi:hypothetical protein X962_5553 [Burkholderia pseudomallei MSHR7343]|nr:hypothetical protein X962_5553 [Burkholderia pseudomallei MSHR7343]
MPATAGERAGWFNRTLLVAAVAKSEPDAGNGGARRMTNAPATRSDATMQARGLRQN